MQSGSQTLTTLSMPRPGDTELRPCHKLTLTIIQNMLQMKRLSDRASLIQRSNRLRCSETVILQGNSQKREPWRSTSTSRIRLVLMDLDNLSLTTARATWWTQPSGIAPAGPLRETLTLIRTELNIENNSTNPNLSTIELLSRVQESCVTRTWPTSQETWESLVSVARISITSGLRRPAEDTKTVSQSTSMAPRNEELKCIVNEFKFTLSKRSS